MSKSLAKVSDLVSELTKTATLCLDDAMKKGIAAGNKTLRDVRVWWIKEERVSQGSPSGYHVKMMIGFVIDESEVRPRTTKT